MGAPLWLLAMRVHAQPSNDSVKVVPPLDWTKVPGVPGGWVCVAQDCCPELGVTAVAEGLVSDLLLLPAAGEEPHAAAKRPTTTVKAARRARMEPNVNAPEMCGRRPVAALATVPIGLRGLGPALPT